MTARDKVTLRRSLTHSGSILAWPAETMTQRPSASPCAALGEESEPLPSHVTGNQCATPQPWLTITDTDPREGADHVIELSIMVSDEFTGSINGLLAAAQRARFATGLLCFSKNISNLRQRRRCRLCFKRVADVTVTVCSMIGGENRRCYLNLPSSP